MGLVHELLAQMFTLLNMCGFCFSVVPTEHSEVEDRDVITPTEVFTTSNEETGEINVANRDRFVDQCKNSFE